MAQIKRPRIACQVSAPAAAEPPSHGGWRHNLPVLMDGDLVLREIEHGDAIPVTEMLGPREVTRFMSALPATPDSFARFVAWAHQQRAAGQLACYAVLPPGMTSAVGLFQLRSLEPGFATGEWGFALGSPYWGTGVFMRAAHLVCRFAFSTVGVRRLEARACVDNGRGNGALRKIGATPEGVLRRAFRWEGQYVDQVLWSILDSDWPPGGRG